MHALSASDSRHLLSAIGWIELGNHLEANEELEKISPLFRAHPDVLHVRWMVYAKAEKWEGAFEIARTLVSAVPDQASGWLQQATSIRHLQTGGPAQAFQALLPVAEPITSSLVAG